MPGTRLGNQNARRDVAPEMRDSVLTLWEAGDSLHAICKKVGLGRVVATRVVREGGYDVEDRRGSLTGEEAYNWRGGEVVTGKGYIGVRLYPGDPHFAMRNGHYVLKHRLVMAQHLGRDLRSDETVHHINGDRADNRIENLQLRQGQHGVGAKYICNHCGSHDVQPIEL